MVDTEKMADLESGKPAVCQAHRVSGPTAANSFFAEYVVCGSASATADMTNGSMLDQYGAASTGEYVGKRFDGSGGSGMVAVLTSEVLQSSPPIE
ncbi:hypothetical protein ASF62_11890 [Leifsonia sp. Leaf325]|nr:hypothetical protein ASF62_11890 [Leifsonia sp. Leaf325]